MEHWKVRKPAEQRLAHQAALRSKELDRVQAKSLRRLMDPHFLFNALNGIMHDHDDPSNGTAPCTTSRPSIDWPRHQIQAGHDGWRTMEDEWTTLYGLHRTGGAPVGPPHPMGLGPVARRLEAESHPRFVGSTTGRKCPVAWFGRNFQKRSWTPFTLGRKIRGWHVSIHVHNTPNSSRTQEPEPVRPDESTPRRRHANDLIRQRLNLLDRSGKSGLRMVTSPHNTQVNLIVPCTSTR